MKKRIFLFALMVVALSCFMALSVFAAEPDASRESVTLSDGTVCPIWDTDGNGLIWYVVSTDENGVNTYAYVSATDPSVDYYNGWSGGNQMNTVKITANGTTYEVSSMAVVNISKDVKITSGQRVGNLIDYFAAKSFYGSKTLQYVYLPTITTNLASEMFKSCSNLKYINFEDLTALTTFGNQALNACSSLFAGEVLDLTNVPLTSLGSHAFTGTKVTGIILPSTLESINGGDMFSGCTELETVIGLRPLFESGKIKSINNYMFNSCKVLKNVDGLMTDGILIIPEGITSVGSLAFSECDQIKYVEFPSTIDYVGQACFSWCDNLTLVSFDKVDAKIRTAIANGEAYKKVTFNNCGTFKGCPKLVAMSVPMGTTELINRFVAQGCTSLTAFYMPDTIVSMGTNGGGQGPFCGATNLYFVNEAFTVGQCLVDGEIDLTRLNLPSKPTVYYMPNDLTTTHGHVYTNQYSKDGTLFQNCKNINDVIVFGENFVDYNARNAFQGVGTADSPKTVVFLGDMTQLVTFKNAQYINFVFANKADKSPEDLNIIAIEYDQGNTDSYMYFCYDSSRYSYRINKNDMDADLSVNIGKIMATKTAEAYHVSNPLAAELSRDATCIANAYGMNYCFCGDSLGESEILGTALGHKHTIDVQFVYDNFMAEGYHGIKCERCDDAQKTETLDALFIPKGISAKTFGTDIGLIQGYELNRDAMDAYKAYATDFDFGILAFANKDGSAVSPKPGDDKVVDVVFDNMANDYIEIKLTGVPADCHNIPLVFCIYVMQGGKFYYLNDGITSDSVIGNSYNEIVG